MKKSALSVGLIDYGAGNLRSVANSLKALGIEPKIILSPEDISGLTHLILPGVGSFGDCAEKLRESRMDLAISDWIAEDRPFLGICVGYQVLFDESEESPGIPGLGIFAGKVIKFLPSEKFKVPHMGWNNLIISTPSDPIWREISKSPWFYFVHSYYPQVTDSNLVAATCLYSEPFAAAIRRGNLFATQFHPEKSQTNGLTLLKNFLS